MSDDKKPASTEVLGGLHSLVARVLTKQLKLADDALAGELTPEQIGALEHVLSDTKVSIGAAIAFLKNNGITASVEKSQELQELERTLSEKRTGAKGRLNKADLEDAARAFEQMQGLAPDSLQ